MLCGKIEQKRKTPFFRRVLLSPTPQFEDKRNIQNLKFCKKSDLCGVFGDMCSSWNRGKIAKVLFIKGIVIGDYKK